MNTMEDGTSLSSELHRRNNNSIRRKPLNNDDNTRNYGSEEDNDSAASDSSAPASNDNQQTTSQNTGIAAVIKSLWMFLNLPIVTNAVFAFMIIQCAVFIAEKRQAARGACADREHKTLLEAAETLTNQLNGLTESMAAMAKNLEGL
jgi:hypothetical protein